MLMLLLYADADAAERAKMAGYAPTKAARTMIRNATRKQYTRALEQLEEYWAASSHAVNDGSDYIVYSYSTIVARINRNTLEQWVTDQKYSVTTSKFCGIVKFAWRDFEARKAVREGV